MANQQPAPSHRSLTGFVTKLVGDGATYGFINEEIFFPQTNVSGGPAAVGDQVFAECEFSAHLPIKWNATSVKIINKAGGQQQQQPGNSNNSVADRPQDLMNQQQFNQAPPVAVTYQQHRQQRQQRQESKQQGQQDGELTARLLENTNNPGQDFFNNPRQFAQQQQQQQQTPQQQQPDIQPFQDQPMGPPNFTYTSQLGSAFVQNQFVAAPFIAQQPPSLLPPQPQQPPHLLPNNSHMHNMNNQRQNNHQNKGGMGRFNNNQGDKGNERQNNRRNMNRNDDKFDRQRSGERDNTHNNRASKSSSDSRDRSIGRNSKREDIPTRPSPPSHSSARSTTSVSSDRGGPKGGRRHYEIQNIPKTQIMTNMNAYSMKQRCPSSVHVPSDLKDIIVNRHYRLDIKNTPKPLKFTIEPFEKDTPIVGLEKSNSVDLKTEGTQVKKESSEDVATGQTLEFEVVKEGAPNVAGVKAETGEVSASETGAEAIKSEIEPRVENSTPQTKSDIKLNHKYGVKVILLSLPEFETIYKEVFGTNLDSFSVGNKSYKKLDDIVSLLCNKGSNNGYSLVGGKFDPGIDGFVDGETNEFERQGRQPNLINTCKRVVVEQTGLDLRRCRSWTLLSTFIYNNKSDYFSQKASIEYSFIYIPELWTMLSERFDKNILNIGAQKEDSKVSESNAQEVESSQEVTNKENEEQEIQDSSDQTKAEPSTLQIGSDQNDSNIPSSSVPNEEGSSLLGNLSELKVADLKSALDSRQIKYKGNAKKAELVALLKESLEPNQQQQDESQVESKSEGEPAAPTTVTQKDDESQPEEGEVLDGDGSEDASMDARECDATTPAETEPAIKRKASEEPEANELQNKKLCGESASNVKEKKVELIREAFIVRSRDEQQQLALVSLNEACQASRYDQFELSVASNVLKEALVQHLGEYILTTLVEADSIQKGSSGNGGGSQGTFSSQESTTSDTNNNNKSLFKNPTTSSSSANATDQKSSNVNLKELPVDRYINLALSYFDSTHMGYVYFEDLNKLFNNTGLTLSKRALTALLSGDGDKLNYRTVPDLTHKVAPTYVYQFPGQFTRLPGAPSLSSASSSSSGPNLAGAKVVEFKGVTYDLERLIEQVREAETLRVSLVDRFNYAIENSDKQAEEIHVLEVSQKSLAKAIKAQNDEICDLKRERDSIKKKYENVRKGIKGTISSLNDLVKEDKQ